MEQLEHVEPDYSAILTGETCFWCGGPEWIDLWEVYPEDRAFQFLSCCEGSYEGWAECMQSWDRKTWAAFFEQTAGIGIRRVVSEYGPGQRGGQWTIDWGLELREITQREARAFVADHHQNHRKAPAGWRWGHAVYNGDDLVGVAWVGRPVARKIDHHQAVEVNRVAVRRDLVPGLAWNACSMLYGAAVREARRRGFSLVLTYTLEDELGTTPKAAGFQAVARSAGGSWDRKSRRRQDHGNTGAKIRWERTV